MGGMKEERERVRRREEKEEIGRQTTTMLTFILSSVSFKRLPWYPMIAPSWTFPSDLCALKSNLHYTLLQYMYMYNHIV